jgi:hypothetical protein
MELYIDGANDGGTYGGSGGSLKYAGANGSSFVGGVGPDIGVLAPFDGEIDEVAVWDRALSGEEVEQVYQGGSVTGGICLPR